MYFTIAILTIALCWLLTETDFLRLRIIVGPVCRDGDCDPWRLSDEFVDEAMKWELLNKWGKNLSKIDRAKLEQGLTNPLCGWGYAYQFRDFQPECHIEMNLANVRYSMNILATGIIKDVMKANKLTRQQKLALWAEA